LSFTIRWIILGAAIGLLSGIASSALIFSLRVVTDFRTANLWIIAFLPVAGALLGWLYSRIGRGSEKGSDLIIDEVLEFRGQVLFRMGPLILLSTLLTHLFGGSAGRESTAVQMGGSLASKLARILKLKRAEAQMLMMAGISGGFSSIFGTPVAGAIFGMEVIARGQITYVSAIGCVASAVVGNLVAHGLTPVHESYNVPPLPPLDLILLSKLLLASVPFALASALFSEATHYLADVSSRYLPRPMLRPFVGGLLVLALFLLVGDARYLGLSAPFVNGALNGQQFPFYAFLLKILFTAVTLGFGFRGGEVYPLFVIGALLGSALGPLLFMDPTILAAIGFVAVFAAASKTPIAGTIMGIEIFGASYAVPFLLVNFIGYVVAGHSGIYTAQKKAVVGFDLLEDRGAENS
jgi:H+/Cl- antiporter ClcA